MTPHHHSRPTPDTSGKPLLDVAVKGRPGEPTVVEVGGELDLATAPRLSLALDMAERHGSRSIVLDLAELRFVDASGLRVLVDAARRAREGGWSLSGRNPSPPVSKLLELVGLERSLLTVESEPSAG